MPILVAAIGLLTVRAGLRIRFGRGPLTSALYSPGYPPVVIRFVLTAIVANFVIVALVNELVPSR
jgi:multisubunit Na+/H+ antiporter MnhC subunit